MAVSLSMLGRWVFTVWGAWLGALGLSAALTASQVLNPNPVLPAGLPILMVAAWLGLLVAATLRLIRGPRRDMALASLLVGSAPLWFSVGHVLMAIRPAFDRHVPPGWPSKVLLAPGRSLADLESRWLYPERTPGKWVTMVGARSKDARAQVTAMDRHINALLARLEQPATWPIVWYRGSILGLGPCAIYDMALGPEAGQWPLGADGLTDTDRHEVAHCVITRNCTALSDPPRVLMEGWAQANQGTPAEELAVTAWGDHEKRLSLTLRQLVAPDWYWYSGQAAYNQGGPLANYLLRVYGPEKFLKLYTTCQQATFEADCRATLGIGLDELDAAYWADTEQIARRIKLPAHDWLKSLKLDPSIDPAAWDAFLTDYFAAADRQLAPFDHVRLTATFRLERETTASGHDPHEDDERLTLLRSGPFARVRHQYFDMERAILAHPDHSLSAFRRLRPELGPWTIGEDDPADPLEAYRQALSIIESKSNGRTFLATHGGAALLEYPQTIKEQGMSPDLEVARLSTSTDDGHPRITLGMQSRPGASEADRQAFTFVFAVDDSFVVRSFHYELPKQKLVSDCRFEYDHRSDGRPVLRSLVTTTPGQNWTIRVDVEEFQFGPIPETEFALEPFLAELKPGEMIQKPVVEPAVATLLGWYWMAFVAGGISLAGGSGLALRSRNRDRQAPRAD